MTIADLIALGNKFRAEKNYQMAFGTWSEVLKLDPLNGPVHLNMADVFREQNQLPNELKELNIFWQCPLTPVTFDLMAQVKNRREELSKQLKPPGNK